MPSKLKYVIVALVVLALLVMGGFLFAVLPPVDTTTKEYDNAGYRGTGGFGAEGTGDGEMELWGRIVTAIDTSKDSEAITIQGRIKDVGLTNCILEPGNVRYVLTFYNDFALSGTPPTTQEPRKASYTITTTYEGVQIGVALGAAGALLGPGGFVDLQAWTFRLRGTYAHGAIVDVDLWAKCVLGQDIRLAWDRIQLLSGWGKVTWGANRYQVGDNACFTWDVP